MQRVTLIFVLLFCGHVAFSMKLLSTTTTNMTMKAKGDSEILIENVTDDDKDDHENMEDLSLAASERE